MATIETRNEVLATLTTRERRRGAWQIWLQGKCFDAVGAVAGDPSDVKMEEGRAEILFHKHGRRNLHAHSSSNRCVIDLTSLAVAKHFGACTVEVTAGRDAVLAERDGVKTLVITRV